jgi:transcription initiation factor TFIIIB Brf1 subunit/transcription initiation factor TFIIB
MYNLNIENEKCSVCGGRIIKTPEGELVCSSCGLVKGHELMEPEYTLSAIETNRVRYVSYVYTDKASVVYGVGSKINAKQSNNNIKRLNNYDKKIKIEDSGRIIEKRILSSMELVASKLEIPNDVLKRSIIIYAKTLRILNREKKKISGVNKYALSAASLITAVWESGQMKPLTLSEIADLYKELGHRVDNRNIAWALIHTRKMMQRHVTLNERIQVYIDRITSQLYINTSMRIKIRRVIRGMDLNTYIQSIRKKALEILNSLSLNVYQSKNPYIIAASLIYIAEKIVSKELKTRSLFSHRILSTITGLSDYSIRDNAQNILSYLGIKINTSSTRRIREVYPDTS